MVVVNSPACFGRAFHTREYSSVSRVHSLTRSSMLFLLGWKQEIRTPGATRRALLVWARLLRSMDGSVAIKHPFDLRKAPKRSVGNEALMRRLPFKRAGLEDLLKQPDPATGRPGRGTQATNGFNRGREGSSIRSGCFAFPVPKLLREQHAFFVKGEKWLNCKPAGGLPGARTSAYNRP